MAWMTAIGAVLGLGQGILGGMAQRDAAAEANAMQEKIAKAQYKRAKKEYKIDWWQTKSNWMWDKARIEAQRYVERQKESDYNWRSQRMIEAAMENLSVNTAALRDRFETEENLRAQQVGMEYSYTMDKLGAESSEAIRQYMSGIRDTALQSRQSIQQMTREQQEIMSSLVFDQEKDHLQWEMAQIASVVDQAQAKAVASARTGGGTTAKRLAMNEAQKLGRAWGEMELNSRSRSARVGLMNVAMRGETATQMGRMALSMQNEAEKIKYTANRYQVDSGFETDKLKRLTIPSFDLAQRQYGRELKSLQIQTQGVIDEASMPYRKAIFFDTPKPIKGLKPEYYAPTKVYEPSMGSIIGQSILGGISSAISFGSYTKEDGTLGWR